MRERTAITRDDGVAELFAHRETSIDGFSMSEQAHADKDEEERVNAGEVHIVYVEKMV